MYVARAVLKQNAKDQLRGIWGTLIAAMLLTMVIMGLISAINQIAVDRGIYSLSTVMSLIQAAVSPIFVVGWVITCLRRIGYQPIEPLTPIKEGLDFYVPSLVVCLLTWVFTFLWMLLLIVPGIIKALAYAMAPYILAENRDMRPIDAITASRKMMDGHKGDLFVLYLSFLGWGILGVITCGILFFYVAPYFGQTLANFYKMLQAEEEAARQSQGVGGSTTPPPQTSEATMQTPPPAAQPAQSFAPAAVAAVPATAVVLVSKGITKQGQNTYETFQADSAVEARRFLADRTVTEPLYYLIVETPEGNWGKDKEGLFMEALQPFQTKLELGTCDAIVAPAGPDMTIFNITAAQRGVVDNFVVNLTCGSCGTQWADGVRYQNKTVVRCPHCGALNIADTANIQVMD